MSSCAQLLNEEGLPIIEITEPIHGSEPQPSPYLDVDAPIPTADLSSTEKERRRRERDRILDLLEEEEEMEQVREEESSEEQRQEILRKRKQAGQDEVARLKAAKDMQRKMGKALLRDMSSSHDQTAPQLPPSKQETAVQDTAPTSKKTVTFADAPAAPEIETSAPREVVSESDWGDVIPARLRANSGRSLMSSARFDAGPMKMQVVERIPGKPVAPQPDSDDESEPPDSPTISDLDEEEASESNEELAEELDLDFARHQREIALKYHAKRVKMTETTSDVMRAHFQNDVSHTTVRHVLPILMR